MQGIVQKHENSVIACLKQELDEIQNMHRGERIGGTRGYLK